MKRVAWVLVLMLLPLAVSAAEPPSWAFPVAPPDLPRSVDDGTPKTVPGSSRSYTQKQIDDNFNAPDWFPDDHAPMPAIVAHGSAPDVPACAKCHLASGLGHPESAALAGLPAGYTLRQLAEFKSGERQGSSSMKRIASALSDADAHAAAAWFAALKPQVWTKIVESATTPKSFVGEGNMRVPSPQGGTEPLGERIIELPQDPQLVALRDPRAGFVAYVPGGSVARGRALVTTGGGKTVACAICHGQGLKGLAEVPALAGRSPVYLFRQLYDIRDGTRTGIWTELMKPVVTPLGDDDLLAIAAYVASLPP